VKVFSGDAWRIELPDDWEKRESAAPGIMLFETGDETKSLYLATWTLGAHEKRAAADVVRAFCDVNETALAAMNMEWKKLHEGTGEQGGGPTILTDHFAAANIYRIITKIIARPPTVVRGAFHDYLCDDYRASTAYFTPIVDSLVLLQPAST
jgi:hypothetical protein